MGAKEGHNDEKIEGEARATQAEHAKVLTVLAVAFILSGCGKTAEERAQTEWEFRSGAEWAAFQDGYDEGWQEGCDEAALAIRKLHADDPDIDYYLSGCGHGPPINPEPAEEVPVSPPDHPREAGYRLGLSEGCQQAISAYDVQRDELDCYDEPSSWAEAARDD